MSNKFTEIVTDVKDFAKDVSDSVVPGIFGGDSKANGKAQTVIAQYPAERASVTGSMAAVSSSYSNGLLFTAYNYESRTTTSLKTFRKNHQNNRAVDTGGFKDIIKSGISGMFGMAGITQKFDKNAIAVVLMPRSQTDVDVVNHKFNSVNDSIMTSGGGTATGAISQLASHALFGAVESITNGYLADHGEQIQVAARSLYGGPEPRVKTFTWTLTPRTVYDLIEIVKINEIFTYLSYGKTGGKSSQTKELKNAIDSWYKETILEPLTPDGADTDGSVFSKVTDFLTNVLVVSNPTIWTVENFGSNNALESRTAVFGPAQIQSIRFDRSSNGNFTGLAIAPNLPNSFTLEITMHEVIALSRTTLYKNSVGGL